MIIKNCKKCQQEFKTYEWEVRRGRGNYCSKACASSDRIMKESTRIKIGLIHSGSKNHFWRGGTAKLNKRIRANFRYDDWRAAIFKRDNYTCQRCNDTTYTGHKIKIHPHHMFPFAKLLKFYNIKTIEEALACAPLWDISNGITLCVDCHEKTDTYLKH